MEEELPPLEIREHGGPLEVIALSAVNLCAHFLLIAALSVSPGHFKER